MSVDNTAEVLDIVTGAVDKHLATDNFEKAAQLVKEGLDRKFGASWHCVIGEVGARVPHWRCRAGWGAGPRVGRASTRRRIHTPRDPNRRAPSPPIFRLPTTPPCAQGFSYNVTYQARNTLFCYYAEKGVLVWKA